MRYAVVLALVLALAVGGCSSDDGESAAPATIAVAPTVVVEPTELEALEATSVAFFDRFYEEWPDLEARFSEFADDAVFFDPTFGDYWIGPQAIADGWGMMPSVFPELEGRTKSMFVSVDGAVFSVDWVGFWLGTKPEEVPWPAGLEVFRFDGDLVASQDLWYTGETLEGEMQSCGGCSTELASIANRYVAAWSSGDTEEIASLYSDGASFSDTMFGIEATGADEISQSIAERFGSAETTMNTREVYGVTLGGSLTPLAARSQAGSVIGVGIRYEWTVDVGGVPTTVDSLVLSYFGRVVDGKFVPDPQHLIVREEVFHDPVALGNLTP